jgi:ABC-type enterobactin transport system permease subunit
MIIKSLLFRVGFVLVGLLAGAAGGLATALLCYIIGMKLSNFQYHVIVISFSVFGLGSGLTSAITFKTPKQIARK